MADNSIPDDLPSDLWEKTLRRFPFSMVLSDPHLPDCPLIYVNDVFVETTGYTAEMAIGKNCRFLQGEHTREEDKAAIRTAIEKDEDVTVDILNYRADGTRFINRLLIAPLSAEEGGETRYLMGVQTVRSGDVSVMDRADELDRQLEELQHRVKNHLSMILAMIRLEASDKQDAETFARIVGRRIEALSVLYDEFCESGDTKRGETVSLGAYLSRVSTTVHALDGRPAVRLNTDFAPFEVDLDFAARLGLYLSEVLTNAFQHAFESDDKGEVRVSLTTQADKIRLVVEDDGRGPSEDTIWPQADSLGGRIVLQLVQRLGGALDVDVVTPDADRPGMRVTLQFDR